MRKKTGFTLVELMLYMGLMASLLVVLTEIFLSVMALQTESSSVANVGNNARFVLARLFYDFKRADTIVTPTSLGQTTATAEFTVDGVNYTYGTGSDGELTITSGGETDNLTGVGSRISDLSFTRLGNVGGENSLQIKYTLTEGKESRNYQTTVALR